MTEYEQITQLVTLLNGEWNADNVAKPDIEDITDESKESVIDLRQADKCLLYEVSYSEEWADLNCYGLRVEGIYSIDIRTIVGRTRLKDLFNEVKRILIANRHNPFTGIQHINPQARRDLSDRRKKIYRYVYDVALVNPYKSST